MGDNYYELDQLTVEAAFGYEPLDTSPLWTDITAYVRAIPNIQRGRSDEYSQYAPGTATVVLDNRGRRFDPEHATGPYFGDLLPMVPIRIFADHDSVNYPMFYGYVQGWPQAIGKGYTDSTVNVTLIDGFRILAQRRLGASAYRTQVFADAPIAYYPFASGSYVDEVAGNDLTVTYPASHEFTAADLAWIPASGIEATQQGIGFNARLGAPSYLSALPRAIEFVFRLDGSSPDWGSNFPIQIVAGSATGDYFNLQIESDDVNYSWADSAASERLNNAGPVYFFQSGRTYHFVISIDADDVGRTYIDGVLINEASLAAGTLSSGTPPLIGLTTQQRLAHLSIYDAPLSSARVTAHYEAGASAFGGDFVERTGTRVGRVLDDIGWPTAWRDISTGDSALGPYLPASKFGLAYLRELEQVEQGSIFIGKDNDLVFRDRSWHIGQGSAVTFADEYDTGLPFRDVTPDANTVTAIRNTATVTWPGGTVTAMDDTSVAAFGPGDVSVSSDAIRTAFDAADLARWLIRLGKDPRTRITRLIVTPRRSPDDIYPELLSLDLGSVITVSIRPLGVGASTEYLLAVQGYQHRITRQEWVTDLYLAPAVASSGPYWKIGDPTLGKIGVAFGNQLHY